MAVDRKGENLLQIRDLSVTYSPARGKMVRALNRLSLEIRPGEILAIIGESGCGKSTLARTLLRLLPPHATYDSGAILFRGRDLLDLAELDLRAIRGKEISLIAQDPALALNPIMKAGTQISEVLRAHTRLGRGERRVCAEALLQEIGFCEAGSIFDCYPHQLSGGQRQRIVIAQAMACQPALLIADEPTSKLDASLQSEILELLANMRQRHGTTVVIISHDPALMGAFADRIAVMYAGRVVEVGPTAQVFRQPLHPYTKALVQLANSSVIEPMAAGRRFPVSPEWQEVSCCLDGR